MPGREAVRDLQSSFEGGLNTTADESQLAKNELRVALNCRLTEYGGITKRGGTQRAHTTALAAFPIKGGFTWRKPTPASHLALCNGHLFTAAHGGYPWTMVDHGAGFDTTALPSFASFRDLDSDVVYIADGGALNKWDGLTLSLNLTSTPAIKRLAVHNLRLFGCGDPANPETLYHSALSDGDTLGNTAEGGGSGIVRTFSHEPLTGLLAVGNSLLLFHERGISRFTGWGADDFNIEAGTRGVSQDVGTISPNTLVAVENVGFFLSDRGAYAVTESGVQQISAKIEATLSAIPASDLLLASAVHHRAFREVWFAIPNLGVMVYNYRRQAWTGPLVGLYIDHSPFVFWESGAGIIPQILMGSSDGFVRQADPAGVFKEDVLADGTGGSAVTMAAQCHRMFFKDPATEKSLRYFFVTANLRGSQGAGLSWNTGPDSASVALTPSGTSASWGGVIWGSFNWGPSGSVTQRRHAHGRGPYVDLTITDDGVSNPVFSRLEADGFAMGRRF